MRNLVFLSVIIHFCSFGFCQTSKISSSNQYWIQYYSQFKLSNKWQVGFDAGCRWRDNFSQLSQLIVRANATYQIGTKLKIGFGYVQSGIYNNSTLASLEYRPFEELSFDHKKEKYELSNRLRFEQRFLSLFPDENSKSSCFIQRVRFNFTFAKFLINPLKQNNNFQIWWLIGDELFINIMESTSFNWFDQNRLFSGPLLKLNSNLSVQLLYSAQISRVTNSPSYRLTNVVWMSLKHKINCVKEK